MRTRLRTLEGPLVALSALVLSTALASACSSTEPGSSAGTRTEATPEARALVRAIKARFPGAFTQVAEARTASVELPSTADSPLHLRDDASRIEVTVALEDTRGAAAATVDDLTLYAGAAPGGGDLLLRTLPDGVEDLVAYSAAPPREKLAYRLDVRSAAGLRLVEGVLEVLDASGAPVLRAAPPYVLDESGRHEAVLRVHGCAVDSNPLAPFRRPVTPPGASSCEIEVDWSAAGVRYPALVDPVWGTTFNTLSAARTRHTLTLLNPTDPKSFALVAGGFATVGGAPLKTAEIYDPLSRHFSATGSMSVARGAHTATLLAPLTFPPGLGPQLPVLVAGGADAAGQPISSLEVYDPASGVFVTDSNVMTAFPRFEHADALIGNAQVLLAGGTAPPLNQPTNTGYTYAFTGFGAGSPPASVNSSLTLLGALMTSARTGLTATRLNSGQVLLAGGFVLAGGKLQALQTGELYDPPTASFAAVVASGANTTTLMATQRGYHTATLLGASGTVLIAGGLSLTVNGNYSNTVDLYLDGSQNGQKGFVAQQTAITMASSRANHTATLLPDGRVLVAGGFNGSSALSGAELFSPVTSKFTDLGPLVPMVARGDHAALLVNAGDSAAAGHTVLVTGGATSPIAGAGALAGAQVLLRVNGDPCGIADECLSGFCVDGVCCDEACTEECYACSAATKQSGADGTCGFAIQGADPHTQCINELETHTQCDGKGSTEQTSDTHDCKPGTCGANGLCSTGCDSTADCSLTGWCDLSKPSGGGQAGTCQPKNIDSTICLGDDECKSGFCIDGVCCNSLCKEQCQACDVPGFAGQCQPVGSKDAPGAVHSGALHPRTSCAGFTSGKDNACSGTCQGTIDIKVCQYPTDTAFLGDPDCTDDTAGGPSALLRHPCDSKGGSTDKPEDCGSFRCQDAHTCKATCAADADCITDFACVSGACTSLATPLCGPGPATLRRTKAAGGELTCPDNFACRPGEHACVTACDSATDCVNSFVCNSDHKCVALPAAPVLPSCSASPVGDGTGSTPLWIAGLGALLASRRRRGCARAAR